MNNEIKKYLYNQNITYNKTVNGSKNSITLFAHNASNFDSLLILKSIVTELVLEFDATFKGKRLI
jgi:hypothetical protein